MMMQEYIAFSILILLVASVLFRVFTLKKQGIKAIEFGKKDKKDFFIPPFALLYFYIIAANTFSLPTIYGQDLFRAGLIAWIGVIICFIGLIFFIWTLVSFKKSFRVGLSENTEQGLVTTGAFAVSRNPIYVAFAMTMAGQFLVFPSWILLLYFFAGIWLFNRQVLREEGFLKQQYGSEYVEYCNRVRRYL
jgi:protein-S-isoprenylcysteine O-methyltransferase Ste14